MKKKIIVLHPEEKLMFSIGDREVKVSDTMPLADAELIASQYPGRYLEIVEEPESLEVVSTDVAPAEPIQAEPVKEEQTKETTKTGKKA